MAHIHTPEHRYSSKVKQLNSAQRPQWLRNTYIQCIYDNIYMFLIYSLLLDCSTEDAERGERDEEEWGEGGWEDEGRERDGGESGVKRVETK